MRKLKELDFPSPFDEPLERKRDVAAAAAASFGFALTAFVLGTFINCTAAVIAQELLTTDLALAAALPVFSIPLLFILSKRFTAESLGPEAVNRWSIILTTSMPSYLVCGVLLVFVKQIVS